VLYSAQRVRAKQRAAVKRREDDVEAEEMESGELNLIPFLDIVTNLMLFLLASVSSGLILVQIDTTLPDKGPPQANVANPATKPDDQPLKLFLSVKRDEMILWSATGLEGTLLQPKPGYTFKRVGRNMDPCDGGYMCESNFCDPATLTCAPGPEEIGPVYEYRRFNEVLVEIAGRRYGKRPRKADTYTIVLQADGAIPYGTIASIMSAMRCKLPEMGKPIEGCKLPSSDPALKKDPNPIAEKTYDTERAPYDQNTMALFHDIQFSTGLE